MGGSGLGLDVVAAAVSKVRKDKKAAKKQAAAKKADKSGKALNRARPTVSAAVSGVIASSRVAQAATKVAPARTSVPLGQQQRYVYDKVKEARRPVPFEELAANLKLSVSSELLALLKKHPLLAVDTVAQTVSYVPKFRLASRDDMLLLIRRRPFGVVASDLKDASSSAADHLAELEQAASVFVCEAVERGGPIVFPNDVAIPGGPPDEAIRDLVFDVELPQREAEVDAALRAAGIAKAKRTTPRRKLAVLQDDRGLGKKKKERAIRNVTNAHVAHIFQELGE